MTDFPISGEHMAAAMSRLDGLVTPPPLLENPAVNTMRGVRLLLKDEILQLKRAHHRLQRCNHYHQRKDRQRAFCSAMENTTLCRRPISEDGSDV